MPPTATPTGTIVTAEDIFIEGAPDVWYGGVAQYSPDADGFYHGITGIAGNPVYRLGCYENFEWADNVATTEIRCDTVGLVQRSQTREYLVATFDLKALFPLSMLQRLVRGGTVVWNDGENAEKMGIGEIDNTDFFPVFFSRVYDPDEGDFVSVTGHRCQFTGNFRVQFPFSGGWMISGLELAFYADDTKPTEQRFATVIRVDASAL